jgi:hypothetical protein
MASEQPDPATLRALADRLANLCRDCGFDRPTCLADRRERLCAECSAAVALRACADAQERPAATAAVDHAYDCGCYWSSGNLVACSEHSPEQARISARLKSEAPAAPAAPFEIDQNAPSLELTVYPTAAPALSDDTLRAMAREHTGAISLAVQWSDDGGVEDELRAFARAVLAAR